MSLPYDSNSLLILDKLLFEYLNSKTPSNEHYDDVKLKRLNTILSNIPYNMLKQSYDNYQKNYRLETKTNEPNPHHQMDHTQKQPSRSRSRTESKQFYNHFNANNNLIQNISSNFMDQLRKNQTSRHEQHHVNRSHSPSLSTAASHHHNQQQQQSSNLIVIHVCDETKQIKRDFTCPRDLLLREMKYFTNNLNLNNGAANMLTANTSTALYKRLDEMDISVHCDVNIFDWLMKYVKRNLKEIEISQDSDDHKTDDMISSSTTSCSTNRKKHQHTTKAGYKEPRLEINNCVSILISSDFLIMSELVDKCIHFMIENFNQILQLPCNMSTINDKLITKICAFIRLDQLDELSDRKDKFKTKLFMKKIEFLFDYAKLKEQFDLTPRPLDHLAAFLGYENDAQTLFKCKICSRIMTYRQSLFIKCELGILDKHGNFNYFHINDDKFDVNAFLLDLKDKLKTWQSVFWFMWALIKCAKCLSCNEWFRFVDLNKCASVENIECYVHGRKRTIYFANLNEGDRQINCICRFKDHCIDQTSLIQYYLYETGSVGGGNGAGDSSFDMFYTPNMIQTLSQQIADDLISHKDTICYGNGIVSSNSTRGADGTVALCNIYECNNRLIAAGGNNDSPLYFTNFFLDSITGKHITFFNKNYIDLLALSCGGGGAATAPGISQPSDLVQQQSTSTTQSTNDITTYLRSIYDLDALNVFNSSEFLQFLKADTRKKWDSSKQARWNQDNQREDDTRRFREISNYLNSYKIKVLQEHTNTSARLKQHLHQQQRDNHAGYYYRIESEWRQRVAQQQQPSATGYYYSSNSTNSAAGGMTLPPPPASNSSSGILTTLTQSPSSQSFVNNTATGLNPNAKLLQAKIRSTIAPIPPIGKQINQSAMTTNTMNANFF